MVLPGITDPLSLEYLNSVIRGNPLIDPDGGRPSDDEPSQEEVVSATASWMRTLEDNAAVLIYGNLAPIRIRLRLWFADQQLRDRLLPPPPRQRRLMLPRWFKGEADDHQALQGFPNPLDSEANDRESARYWDAVVATGTLPEAMEYNDGSTDTRSDLI